MSEPAHPSFQAIIAMAIAKGCEDRLPFGFELIVVVVPVGDETEAACCSSLHPSRVPTVLRAAADRMQAASDKMVPQ